MVDFAPRALSPPQASTAVDTIKAPLKSGAIFVFVVKSFTFRGIQIIIGSDVLLQIFMFYAFRLTYSLWDATPTP